MFCTSPRSSLRSASNNWRKKEVPSFFGKTTIVDAHLLWTRSVRCMSIISCMSRFSNSTASVSFGTRLCLPVSYLSWRASLDAALLQPDQSGRLTFSWTWWAFWSNFWNTPNICRVSRDFLSVCLEILSDVLSAVCRSDCPRSSQVD